MVVQIKDFFGEVLPKSSGRQYALEINGCLRELLNVYHSIIHLPATTMRSRVRSHIAHRRRSLFIHVFHFRRLMPASVSNSSGSTKKKKAMQKTFGKLTKKDVGLHKLVFTEGLLSSEAEVGHYVRGKVALKGCIQGSGILCFCCDNVVTPSQFEAHPGEAQRRKPYNHIYLSNGMSLHEASVRLSKEGKLPKRENDDLCSICADGGGLLLCDYCPRSFHMGLFPGIICTHQEIFSIFEGKAFSASFRRGSRINLVFIR